MIKVELKNFILKDNNNPFCDKCSKDYCQERKKYYTQIVSEKKFYNIYTCPYGYSSILTPFGLYTGLIIKQCSDINKIKSREKFNKQYKYDYSVFDEKDVIDIIKTIESNKFHYEIYRSTVHDIKRALSCILEMVQQKDKGQIDVDYKNLLDGLDYINTRLDYHDRLLVSSNEIAPMIAMIKPCSIGKKISKILEYKAAGKKIKIISKGSPVQLVRNDSKSIYVLFFALIENAIKYAPIGSKITLNYDDRPNKKAYVEIKNECTFITEDELEKIFEKGYRGKNSMDVAGNGLGMEVVKKIFNICGIEYNVKLETIDGKKNFIISFIIPSFD